MFSVNNLSLYYLQNDSKTYLLKDIDFSLDKGDCLGIIGKSGDGKSTLAKALLKIYDRNVYLESGKMFLDNVLVDESFRGKKISLIFQNPNSYLNPSMKVGKQIQEMLTYHFKENKKVAKVKTISIMKEVGIENPAVIYNYYPHEISGGMQQRICLCISIICHPEIIILDEATSYLDRDTKKEIYFLLNSLKEKYNFTLIIISHDFKEIYTMCNKIAIMKKGSIVEFGTKEEIVNSPRHPYTIELLYYFLSYYNNIPCLIHLSKDNDYLPIKKITSTHFARISNYNKELLEEFSKLKEMLYETFRN